MQTVKLATFARLAAAGVMVAPCVLAPGAFAQATPPAEAPSVKIASPKEEAVEKPDYGLLLRAMKAVKDSTAFGYTAQSTLQVTSTGVSVLGHQKTTFVALQGGKLRSNLTLWLGDDPDKGRTYEVVSDGTKLYTYRPEKMQYSVKDLDTNKLQDEISRVGILGALYFNGDLSNLVNGTTPETADVTFEQLQAFGIKFSGSKVGETPVYTLTMTPPTPPDAPKPAATDKADGDAKKAEAPPTLTVRFYVDPDTAQFRQLELTGKQGESRMMITEKIVRQTNRPVYEAPAFKFTPTAKDVKVADVPVDLFKE